MDDFEERLKRDASAIDDRVPPELAARIEASLRGVTPELPEAERARTPETRWWLLSSLTGVAAVLLVIVAINRPEPASTPGQPTRDATLVDTQPAPVGSSDPTAAPLVEVPLAVRPADFTEPLADELEAVKSDIEKARRSLEEDLRFTF